MSNFKGNYTRENPNRRERRSRKVKVNPGPIKLSTIKLLFVLLCVLYCTNLHLGYWFSEQVAIDYSQNTLGLRRSEKSVSHEHEHEHEQTKHEHEHEHEYDHEYDHEHEHDCVSDLYGNRQVLDKIQISSTVVIKSPRILCLIESEENGARIKAIRETWGSECDKLVVTVRPKDASSWSNHRELLKQTYLDHKDEFEWFFMAHDDSFVIVRNLRSFVASKLIQGQHNVGIPLHIGSRRVVHASDFHLDPESKCFAQYLSKTKKKFLFNDGTTGYVMNSFFLENLMQWIDTPQCSPCSTEGLQVTRELMLSHCSSFFGAYPYEFAMDDLGRERFHKESPSALMSDTNSTDHDTIQISPSSIAFQQLSPMEMRHTQHMLYTCNWEKNFDHTRSSLWNLRSALLRAKADSPMMDLIARDDSTPPKHSTRIAIMLQIGTNPDILPDLMSCTANVVAAIKHDNTKKLDLYVSVTTGSQKWVEREIRSKYRGLNFISNIYVDKVDNVGADMGAFLTQMTRMEREGVSYQAILKMHTKTDPIWRERLVESLCGTPEQVRSILTQLDEQGNSGLPTLVAPLGTAFGPNSDLRDVFPHIVEKYELTSTKPVFSTRHIESMNILRQLLKKGQSMPFREDDLRIVAGSAFWITGDALEPSSWASAYEDIFPLLTKGYVQDQGMEHAMERVIPSLVVSRGGTILDVQPAPKVFALYFPQYHRIPENDRFWGEGFTEWTLLRPLEMADPPLRKPLDVEEGGLGYYDLMDRSVRKRQAELALEHGVQGFVYYHFWFSGSNAPPHHKVMAETLEAMLVDNEPNLPFLLSWANEPWTRRWNGEAGDVTLLSQEYGDEQEWDEHFDYLMQFFDHPNYVRVHGKPMFVIYRTGHVGAKLVPMIKRWRIRAAQKGLPGLHIVQTIGNFYEEDAGTNSLTTEAGIDASFHFWPQLMHSFEGVSFTGTASTADLDLEVDDPNHIQYWGAFTGFDRRPRDDSKRPILRSPDDFEEGLRESFRSMSQYANRRVGTNFFFTTAWNEWNEQALLEPDSINRMAYLESLQRSLSSVPMRQLFPWKSIKSSSLSPNVTSIEKDMTLMILATIPRSPRHLLALWTELECLTDGIDKILLVSSHAYSGILDRLMGEARIKLGLDIEARYFVNDRYDVGLWCDALKDTGLLESQLERRRFKYVVLANDSVFALSHFRGILEKLKQGTHNLVSLSEYDGTDYGYWVESIMRGFTMEGLEVFAEHSCQASADGMGCTPYHSRRKKCIIHKYEMGFANSFTDVKKVTGLYKSNPERDPDRFESWITEEYYWRQLVMDSHFPVAKVKNEYYTAIPSDASSPILILDQCVQHLEKAFLLDELGVKDVVVRVVEDEDVSWYVGVLDHREGNRYIVEVDNGRKIAVDENNIQPFYPEVEDAL